jgi:hypothetical protein
MQGNKERPQGHVKNFRVPNDLDYPVFVFAEFNGFAGVLSHLELHAIALAIDDSADVLDDEGNRLICFYSKGFR